ncbi:hypothetical protein HK098_000084 [Nowakowskiella sp. JEL0407]|nr:hypothetical protein HK098_000084 [Nowakowskiella sp. JEL0407]
MSQWISENVRVVKCCAKESGANLNVSRSYEGTKRTEIADSRSRTFAIVVGDLIEDV